MTTPIYSVQAAHGGNIYQFATVLNCSPNEIIDFSSNIHFHQAVNLREFKNINLTPYADPNYSDLKRAISQRYDFSQTIDLELFNGASAAIFSLLRFLNPTDLVLYAPLYGEYGNAAKQLNCNVHLINRFSADLLQPIPKNSTVIFVNPSTPDGKLYEMTDLIAHWQAANCNVIIDESFLDFCDARSISEFIERYDKLFMVKSLCKFYGCAGVRIGFIAAQKEPISQLRQFEPMWKIATFDSVYMQEALKNIDFIEQTKSETARLRAKLEQVLLASNLFEKIYDGDANFVLGRLRQQTGYELQTQLARFKMLIRICESFDFLDSQDVRFAVKSENDIEKLAHAFSQL